MSADLDTQTPDGALAEAITRHHALMVGELDQLSAELSRSASSCHADSLRPEPGPAASRLALEDWIGRVLIPHAEHEEATIYWAASTLVAGRLLIQAMLREHTLIRRLAQHVSDAPNPVVGASYARALYEVFVAHQRMENELILPLLVAEPSISLVEVMSADHRHSHST